MKYNRLLGISEEGFHGIAYTEWGEANLNAIPTICVHGLTRNGRDFDALAAYLSKRGRQVFCPDIVGRGESDWLKNPLHYTFEQYIADMNALIARTGATQVDWVGTSMGGLIGMIMAAMPRSPIRRLVLNDVGPQIPVKGMARLARYAGKDPDFSSMEEAKRYFKQIYADFGNLDETQWQQIAEHSVREVAPGKFVSKVDHGVKRSPAKSQLAWKLLLNPHKMLEGSLFDIDLWQIWRKVSCPVLVLHGSHSDILLPSIIKKMQEIHPEVNVIEVPDAGHAPALQRPEQWDAIYQWLA